MTNLDAGDLYSVDLTVMSEGRRPVLRLYSYSESTYPVEPTVQGPITVSEHNMSLAWNVPTYFSVS